MDNKNMKTSQENDHDEEEDMNLRPETYKLR